MKNHSEVHGPIVEQCGECLRPLKKKPYAWMVCPSYGNPEGKWSQGMCNHARIPKPEETEAQKRAKKAKATTQKASGKKSKGHLHLRKYPHLRAHSKKKYVDSIGG